MRVMVGWMFTVLALMLVGVGCAQRVEVAGVERAVEPMPGACVHCGGEVVAVGTIEDDRTKPSRNLSVWNRSFCGNPLFWASSPYCMRCDYAWSPMMQAWHLANEDVRAFRRPLDGAIAGFPLPAAEAIRSRVVYEQEHQAGEWSDGVSVWCKWDEGYLALIRGYAEGRGLALKTEPMHGELYVRARKTGELEAPLQGSGRREER